MKLKFLFFILIALISLFELVSPPNSFSQNMPGVNDTVPDRMIVYGEYPVVVEVKDSFNNRKADSENAPPLIDYSSGKDYKEKAMIDALHILSANIYGYTFEYQPGSKLMHKEEVFKVKLKGEIPSSYVRVIGSGTLGKIYRVKVEFDLTPSVKKWLSAFRSRTLKLEDAEGTSDFYQGWEGRQIAYRNALKNLVLVDAKRQLSSKPLKIKGDILLKGNPEFNVGAGRYYCRVYGWVNIVNVVTYD